MKKYLAILASACLMALVITSGLVKVNLKHTHTLDGTEPYAINCERHALIFKTCDVFLDMQIGQQPSYEKLFVLLSSANRATTIRFHMNGYGGLVDTTVQLINQMQSSKAHIVTIIEGPVYSAHALISMAGKEIVVQEGALFMFHATSAKNEDHCSGLAGKLDRGQDVVKKCKDMYRTHVLVFDALMMDLTAKFLTPKEIREVLDGFDVYVLGNDMKKRIKCLPSY